MILGDYSYQVAQCRPTRCPGAGLGLRWDQKAVETHSKLLSLPPGPCLLSRKAAFIWSHRERRKPAVWT